MRLPRWYCTQSSPSRCPFCLRRLRLSFPRENRQEYLERTLHPGRIVYLFCDFTAPPKNKYLLLAHVGSPPLLFIINSSIPAFVREKHWLSSCQVKLAATDYECLSHDSHLDCSEVITAFDGQAMRNQLLADVRRLKESISADTKRQVLRAVTGAYTISGVHKSMVLNSLQRPYPSE